MPAEKTTAALRSLASFGDKYHTVVYETVSGVRVKYNGRNGRFTVGRNAPTKNLSKATRLVVA